MDCVQFRELVHDFGRAGTAGGAMRGAVLAHAENCPQCGSLLEKVTLLDFALDSLAVQDSSEQAPARIEAALLAEFRRQHAKAVLSQPKRGFMAALAMAAVLILAIGIAAPRWLLHKQPATANPVAVATLAKPPAVAKKNPAVTPDSTSGEPEYATSFMPLPYADDPGTLDGGAVVRVTLSRAALASFGMPVAGMVSGERIPADIALSEDGVPQAIRLVADANLDRAN